MQGLAFLINENLSHDDYLSSTRCTTRSLCWYFANNGGVQNKTRAVLRLKYFKTWFLASFWITDDSNETRLSLRAEIAGKKHSNTPQLRLYPAQINRYDGNARGVMEGRWLKGTHENSLIGRLKLTGLNFTRKHGRVVHCLVPLNEELLRNRRS